MKYFVLITLFYLPMIVASEQPDAAPDAAWRPIEEPSPHPFVNELVRKADEKTAAESPRAQIPPQHPPTPRVVDHRLLQMQKDILSVHVQLATITAFAEALNKKYEALFTQQMEMQQTLATGLLALGQKLDLIMEEQKAQRQAFDVSPCLSPATPPQRAANALLKPASVQHAHPHSASRLLERRAKKKSAPGTPTGTAHA